MIEIKGVTKEFKTKNKTTIKALDKIDFEVKDSEILALLGTNGSGKSTLLKGIAGVVKMSQGNIEIDGYDSFKKRKHLVASMGVIFSQKSSLISDLTVMDNLEFFGAMYGLFKDQLKIRVEEVNEILHIDQLLDSPVRKLSFGQRMKVELASILLHRPKYLILDEPTIGLDIFAKEDFLNLLLQYRNKFQATIVITTHELELLEAFCDRIVILDKGKIILNSKYNEFYSLFNKYRNTQVVYSEIKDSNMFEKLKTLDKFQKLGPNSFSLLHLQDEKVHDIIFSCLEVSDYKNLNIDFKEVIKNFYGNFKS